MNKAVFLDRDGVINPLVYNPVSGTYEAPHCPEDFSVYTYTARALTLLRENDFMRIIVSNQPDYAKGKATMDNINEIEKLLFEYSVENGGLIDDYNYCYHHPKGIIPAYSFECQCRKPGTLFVEQAVKKYNLDVNRCCFVGDRASDVLCGVKMGMLTVRIVSPRSQEALGSEALQSACAVNLYDAAKWIVLNIR